MGCNCATVCNIACNLVCSAGCLKYCTFLCMSGVAFNNVHSAGTNNMAADLKSAEDYAASWGVWFVS